MTAYALCHVHSVEPCEDIFTYIESIEATLEPFGGRFIVHGGGEIDVVEGSWGPDVIIIEFPDRAAAHGWYHSPAYGRIAYLRTDHMKADLILFDGVPADYSAKETARALRARAAH
ncbi:DUF1330 domain-containing protein [Kitasatospora sp. NPDC056138]|uniref:DUF1330 domain-containing protein n=1 Tax=Kitasatospora sp. NPDC056138 TaxID=3345724 RepID=UPI0035DCFEDA